MSRIQRIAALLVAAVMVVILLLVLFETVEEEVDVPASGMAAINDYYAAERLLASMGMPARTAWRIQQPPEEEGVLLVLLDDSPAFRAEQAESILGWVADGGRLLVASPMGEEAPLLDALGVRRDALVAAEGTLARLPLGRGPAREVDHLPLWTVSSDMATSRWTLTTEEGALLDVAIELPYVHGWVGVVGGGSPWRSDNIGDAENATWLWEMASASGASSALIVVRGGAPSLWSLLWQHGRLGLISLAVLLLAVAGRHSRRFGPLLPAPVPERRRIIEHIEATGAILWRTEDGRGALVRSARAAAGADPDAEPLPASASDFIEEMRRHQSAWRRP
ncbi:MAG: hypothetical protein ACI8S6_000712 [Myxococcota bacterium]|jgi:hypothetical protein